MRLRLPALVFLLLAALLPGAAGADTLLDRVVAVVSPGSARGTRILVTLSDLELEARIALISRGGIGAAKGAIPDDTLAASLDWLVAEHLLLAEAEQLEVAQVEPSAIERAIADFRGRFPDDATWASFLARQEIGEEELARIFRRRLVVDGYLGSRLRLGVTIPEAEIRRAYEARRGGGGGGGASYEELRPLLRAMLEKEKRESLVAALVADVRSRAEVRVLHHLGGPRRRESRGPWYLPGEKPGEGE